MPANMQEAGETVVRELTRLLGLRPGERPTLTAAWEIRAVGGDPSEPPMGVRLEFGPDRAPAILNLADDLEVHFGPVDMDSAGRGLVEIRL
jgi:hypothetical protein